MNDQIVSGIHLSKKKLSRALAPVIALLCLISGFVFVQKTRCFRRSDIRGSSNLAGPTIMSTLFVDDKVVILSALEFLICFLLTCQQLGYG